MGVRWSCKTSLSVFTRAFLSSLTSKFQHIIMLFATLLPLLAALTVMGAPVESPIMGSIETPTSNTPVSVSSTFPFSYSIVNWCEEGYNNFQVFLTAGPDAPTVTDVSSTGSIPTALHNFGQFTVVNFGEYHSVCIAWILTARILGLPPTGTPPPSTLTMPGFGPLTHSSVFLTVVETFNGCPVSSSWFLSPSVS